MIDKNQLKIYLGITDNLQDDLLDMMIKKAIWFAGTYCSQIINKPTETIEEISDIENKQVFLFNYHNVEIDKVYKNTSDSFNPNWELMTSTDYSLEKNLGILNFKFTSNLTKAIKVLYFAGYDTNSVPEDLKTALIELSAMFYYKAGDWKTLKNETVDWDKVEFTLLNWTDKGQLPISITAIFDKYKKYEFFT